MKSLILATFLFCGVFSRSIDNYSATLGDVDNEECTCLMRSERLEGNKITGKYSYVDPVGSLIEVSYEMNQDKTNYVESRKVIKNYVSSATGTVTGSSGLTAEEVVERVITDITPTVILVVRNTVQGSNTDLSSEAARRQLVQSIIVKLRPVVFRVVTEVLLETGTTSLDAGELTDLIVLRLTPVIEAGVNEEAQAIIAQSQAQKAQLENDIVLEITTTLKPTIIRIIQASVQSSDLSDIESLFQAILGRLRGVVFKEVQTALANSPLKLNIDANQLTERIMVELTPFVRQALEAEVQKLQANTLSEDEVVRIIINDLKPTVIKVVRATVGSAQVDLTNPEALLQTILVQLRPVVLNEVQRALSTSTVAGNLNANSLTERIILELTPFVRQALQEEVGKVTSQLEGQVVNQVKQSLDSSVQTVIKDTISQSQINLDDPQGIVESIIRQLRPVVFKAVSVALKSSPYKLDAEKLTVRIIIEIRPSIESGVQAEVEAVKAQQVSQVNDGVIQTIIDRLNPALLGLDFADNDQISQDLADEIVAWSPGRFGGLVKQRVVALLSAESGNLPDSVIAERVVAGMQGDIIKGIEDNAKYRVVVKQKGFNALLQRIISVLRPLILREIQVYKQSQVVVQPVPQPKPIDTSGGLTGIFGVSGKNTVKFDSPNNNYGYEFDRK